MPAAPTVTDLALARRLERAEAAANAAFVDARAAHAPAVGATWRDVAGAWAMFDGVGAPTTQTFGLALFAPAAAADLDALEEFFFARGADAFHEVCPLADPALLALLSDRGYRPVELSTVLRRPLDDVGASPGASPGAPPASGPVARRVGPDELQAWADVAAAGWGDVPEAADFVRDYAFVGGSSAGAACFVAELGGVAVGSGSVALHGGVAVLAGASTLPAYRGRGAQSALLAARLAHAAAAGCDLAVMAAAPGSTSQTNAERQGFRVAYTRTKWHRARPA